MPTSFRNSLQPIPSRYRTPSPPRDAFEPLSPTGADGASSGRMGLQWTDNREDRNGLKRPCLSQHEGLDDSKKQRHMPRGAMDAFASIALATTSNTQSQPHVLSPQLIDEHNDRPSKRAKSEKLPSPDWSKKRTDADTRPSTSYEQSPEDRRLEAELLLNFAQANYAQAAVKVTSPSPVDCQGMSLSNWPVCGTTSGGIADGTTYDLVADGHRCGIGAIWKDYDLTKEAEGQRSPQATAVLYGGETSDSQNEAINGPPIAVEMAHGYPESGAHHQDDQSAALPEASEHDDVDLIPEPSQMWQDSGADRKQTPEKAGDHENHHVSKPCAIASPPQDVASGGQDISGITHQSLVSDQPPAADTSQIVESALQQEGDARLKGEPFDESKVRETSQLLQEDVENESRAIHGALGDADLTMNEGLKMHGSNNQLPSPEINAYSSRHSSPSTLDPQSHQTIVAAVCAACKMVRNSKGVDTENDSTSWISCDACKSWFHFACAGFKNEREVRGVDKFRCRKCKPVHGSTTYVRKSSRAHSAIDYAGLHQGVIKTSDERPEHHYIKPIKEGTISFLPESFARMRPELATAEYFEKGTGMKEPIVIPACFNSSSQGSASLSDEIASQDEVVSVPFSSEDDGQAEDWISHLPESETVPDYGQDALDMVIPKGLIVRQVAELYGPDEKVEVIDVKSQNGENKKWNMKRWADYYENPSNKVVRNVISLEVSQSRLGRLIKRPQVVRDLDLQDSVWPEDLLAKGEYPRVQFYCLMSVADCFTDFHIDFGGSSVFYHILKGKKTFLFIPPKEKHLKKYEEWCMSPAQNWTFLGDQTKECYRVDLYEGDTMLIPSGWIHAVWTPEDSLVIGGNFLTRMNFGMQLRVAQVEKATGVARKFRYPHFQKLHWYTALQYLETDPLPGSVRDLLHAGGSFNRDKPSHYDFNAWGENSRVGLENYHARYYSQSELDGLPDLTRYLLRTALIDIGSITDGISADTRNAVKKSIPRGQGEPLEIIKKFAAWCVWKRGNEPLPHWAYPDAVPENLSPDKLSAAAMKKLDREAALSAPRRQSARMQSQQELSEKASSESQVPPGLSNVSIPGDTKRPGSEVSTREQADSAPSTTSKRHKITSGMGSGSHRKTACESCRKRRRACKHKDQVAASMATPIISMIATESTALQPDSMNPTASSNADTDAVPYQLNTQRVDEVSSERNAHALINKPRQTSSPQSDIHALFQPRHNVAAEFETPPQTMIPQLTTVDIQLSGNGLQGVESVSGLAVQPRPRHKACNECRKSKRRCIHDAFGNEDPVKVRETAIPRPHARKSNLQGKDVLVKTPVVPNQRVPRQIDKSRSSVPANPSALESNVRRMAPVANMVAHLPTPGCHTITTSATLDAAKQRDIAERASLLLDPALFLENPEDSAHQPQATYTSTLPRLDDTQRSNSTTLQADSQNQLSPDFSYAGSDAKPEPAPFESKDGFEQPASSLVSPPASSHDELCNSPTAVNSEWAPSRSSSEQSSTQLKQMQHRYTPESGPVRGASSGSYDEAMPAQPACPESAGPLPGSKGKTDLKSEYVADQESLRLIKELQVQELGLRRREKA